MALSFNREYQACNAMCQKQVTVWVALAIFKQRICPAVFSRRQFIFQLWLLANLIVVMAVMVLFRQLNNAFSTGVLYNSTM